jgi:hypothetical protein
MKVAIGLICSTAIAALLSSCGVKGTASQWEAEKEAIEFMTSHQSQRGRPLAGVPRIVSSRRSELGPGWAIDLESGECQYSLYVDPGKEIDVTGVYPGCDARGDK